MASNLNVTELDFDQIKQNLKNYLKNQSEFSDHNFEGSGLSVLLDVLAYNTHYNAVAAHYSLNEAFLDSAQIRGNVVTRAKLLGYTPRSKLASRAMINFTVNAADEINPPEVITLKRGSKFTSTISGDTFTFVTLNNYSAIKGADDIYTFSNVELAEGTFKTLLFRVDNKITGQKFQLSDVDADTSTLRVRVQDNEESTEYNIYTRFENLPSITSDSQIYYIQENPNERYEIYFGDGVIGKKPVDNNITTLDYVYTTGPEANGAAIFEFSDVINKLTSASTYTVATVAKSIGGTDREDIESIRFNAPLTFATQNRAVTADDYRAIILKGFPNISSISTWGGEDNVPVDFGKVYVAIKPLTSDTLSDNDKNTIINGVLKGKGIVSVTVDIVDPNFTNIELDVFFKYNPNLTDRALADLQSVVRDTISDYSFNQLNRFDGVFRHSELLKLIDSSDPAILSSTVRPYIYKMIDAKTSSTDNNFNLTFAAPFYEVGDSKVHILSSTPFKIPSGGGEDHFFGDIPINNSSDRRVIVYKRSNGENVTVINDAGTLSPSTGNLILHSFKVEQDTTIKVTLTPDSLDIAPKRDQLLNIDQSYVNVTGQVDTISTAGSAGTIDYTVNSRLR